MLKLSIVVPVYNEVESLPLLLDETTKVLRENFKDQYEMVVVDDGSTDGTRDLYPQLRIQYPEIRFVLLSRNYGQSAAMACGIELSMGQIIVPMDGDGQNDPRDIPLLIEHLETGFECVSGWRRSRKDKNLTRKLPSALANIFISRILKVDIHDFGCTLKAYDAKLLKSIQGKGDMHRFLPAYILMFGGRVAELEVNHRDRKFGKSKYGLGRIHRVILDTLSLWATTNHFHKPIHLFGGVGFIFAIISSLSLLLSIALKISGVRTFVDTPLLSVSGFSLLIALQFLLFGLLAEMNLKQADREYLKSYRIKEII